MRDNRSSPGIFCYQGKYPTKPPVRAVFWWENFLTKKAKSGITFTMIERLPQRIPEKLLLNSSQKPTRVTSSELLKMTKKREGRRDLIALPPGFAVNVSLLCAGSPGNGVLELGIWEVRSLVEVELTGYIASIDYDHVLFTPVSEETAEAPSVKERLSLNRRVRNERYWSWLEQQPHLLEQVFKSSISPDEIIYSINLSAILKEELT